jgi:hypothetical protein
VTPVASESGNLARPRAWDVADHVTSGYQRLLPFLSLCFSAYLTERFLRDEVLGAYMHVFFFSLVGETKRM